MKTKNFVFVVSIRMKSRPAVKRLRAYVQEAVECMGGCRDPEDELFSTEFANVEVRSITKPTVG